MADHERNPYDSRSGDTSQSLTPEAMQALAFFTRSVMSDTHKIKAHTIDGSIGMTELDTSKIMPSAILKAAGVTPPNAPVAPARSVEVSLPPGFEVPPSATLISPIGMPSLAGRDVTPFQPPAPAPIKHVELGGQTELDFNRVAKYEDIENRLIRLENKLDELILEVKSRPQLSKKK